MKMLVPMLAVAAALAANPVCAATARTGPALRVDTWMLSPPAGVSSSTVLVRAGATAVDRGFHTRAYLLPASALGVLSRRHEAILTAPGCVRIPAFGPRRLRARSNRWSARLSAVRTPGGRLVIGYDLAWRQGPKRAAARKLWRPVLVSPGQALVISVSATSGKASLITIGARIDTDNAACAAS